MELVCECPICFNYYSDTHKPLICPCGHTACKLCIEELLLKSDLCPICNEKIPSSIKSFTVNYAMLHQQPAKKPSIDHSIHAKKLQEEIKFYESINRNLNSLQNDHLEQIKNTEFQLVNCIKSIENFVERLKSDFGNKIRQAIEFNNAIIKEQKLEISGMIETRQGILKKIIEAQRTGQDLQVATQVELETLENVKQIRVLLRKTEFVHQIEALVLKLGENLQQNFKIQECPYYFSFKSENDLEKIEQFPNDFRNYPNSSIKNDQINRFDLNKNTNFRHQQPIPENPPPARNPPNLPPRNNMEQRRGNPIEQPHPIPREPISNLFDPNIKLEWFILTKNKREKLPEFALGQIERCRVQKKSSIRIFREGRVKFIADLSSMEYLILDNQEKITQTLKLTCSPL